MGITNYTYRVIFNSYSFKFIVLATIIYIFNLIPQAHCGLNNKCYILALEGGGDKGSYQACAISGLINNLESNLTQYDVVTGISVGSVNGVLFSTFEIGAEKNNSEFLLDVWRSLNKSSVYQNWMFGPLEGLLYKTGIYDTFHFTVFCKNYCIKNH